MVSKSRKSLGKTTPSLSGSCSRYAIQPHSSRINGSVLNSPSTLQKTDSISPVPFRCLAPEVTQGAHQASVVRRGNRPLIHKDNATVPPLFFSPTLQQWRNRPPIVGDQRQSPLGSF